MDTSKEYILMCEKAGEIQKNYKFACADNYSPKKEFIILTPFVKWVCKINVVYVIGSLTDVDCRLSNTEKVIWLPRQDQLQNMVGDRGCNYIMRKAYKMFGSVEVSNPKLSQLPMEQLWLTFVMDELYQKSWNGSDWIKTK